MRRKLFMVGGAVALAVVWWRRKKRKWRIEDQLTVILCTSPVRTNPSTALIEETYGSLRHHAAGVAACPTFVICDGYKIRHEPRYRSGQVTAEGGDRYEAYLKNLRRLNFGQMIRCQERLGFGFALKRALSYVTTPFVLVVQHDRNFVRDVDIARLVRAMEANSDWLYYVGLPTSTTLNYQRHVLSKYGIRIEPREYDGLHLVPLLQWYDSTHICRTDHYRQFVYRGDLVKKGGFVEDKLGQKQLADIRNHGLDAHAMYGTFVLDDTAPIVAHLDGHDPLAYRKFKFVAPTH